MIPLWCIPACGPLMGLLTALVLPGRVSWSQQIVERITQTVPGTDVQLTFARIRGGTFLIGSDTGEPGHQADESPRRRVSVASFWMGVHEVTHDQFAVFRDRRLDSDTSGAPDTRSDVDAVSRPSPPYEDPAHGMGGGPHPAAGMTRWAALQYARWLSLTTGRLYRLPTEAEWEFACRAGTQTAVPFDEATATLDEYAWYAGNSGGRFHPVGGKRPNAWGLHDMLGNVAEWTMDAYAPDAYGTWADTVGPWTRPAGSGPHTVRGGAFDDEPAALRCAARLASTPRWQRRDPQLPKSRWWNTDAPQVGFRLVTPDRPYSMEEIRAYWADLPDR